MATVQAVSERANSTVIDRTVSVPNSTTGERSERAVNEFGQAQIKGGTTLSDGFFQSIINGYSNLVNSPLALFLMVFGVVGLLLDATDNDHGPLERLLAMCVAKSKTAGFIGGFASLLAKIISLLIPVKLAVFAFTMFWSPYMAKPSKNNMYISVAGSAFSVLSTFPPVELVLLGQVYFCYTQVRNPKYKFIIILVGLFCFIIGADLLKEIYSGPSAEHKKKRDGGGPAVTPNHLPTNPVVSPGIDPVALPGTPEVTTVKRVIRNPAPTPVVRMRPAVTSTTHTPDSLE